MSKSNKHTQFKITPNTDSVDIDQQCIGLDVERSSWPSDIRDHLKTDRGLHIQIRHNRDKQTYEQANEVSKLIAAAPDLLEALEAFIFGSIDDQHIHTANAIKAITKAKGGNNN